MKLYSTPLSPFAARVRLSIYRKGLDQIEIVPPPEGGLKGPSFLAINPMGQIPTLRLDSGFAIPESATIIEYLEDVFPTPSLRPGSREDLARARLFLRLPDIYFQNAPRTLLGMRDPASRRPEVVEAALGHLERGLGYIDHYLDGGGWAVGGKPSIADSALIPVLNVVALVAMVYQQPDLIAKHARIAAYWEVARTEPIHARVIGEQLAAIPAG
jgi:glutathione S-transferase